ncbi:putative kinesin-like protein KIN-6 isoform X5 [Sesbania bispinosa]|nr:putative kinesin-like protein KIN-6 isoform X5 [Sesbania bispinosa]
MKPSSTCFCNFNGGAMVTNENSETKGWECGKRRMSDNERGREGERIYFLKK